MSWASATSSPFRCRRCRIYTTLCLLFLAGVCAGLYWLTVPARLAARFEQAWTAGDVETLSAMFAGEWTVRLEGEGYRLEPLWKTDFERRGNRLISACTESRDLHPTGIFDRPETVTDYLMDQRQYLTSGIVATSEGEEHRIQLIFVDHDGVEFALMGTYREVH